MHVLFNGLEPLLEALPPHSVRVVGGAVRAWLRHDPLTGVEVDLATSATPQQVLGACHNAKIPTGTPGLRWGTVNVHLAGQEVEITTLRKDHYVNGSRYPTVSFITDWAEDAQRRDFTFNAIYMDPDGSFFDPYNGAEDLRLGVVRFIGDPAQRLREDPLRLLRFWRFCGHYGLGGVTPELLDTFRTALPALQNLSRTRVTDEWTRLQQTPQSATVTAELQRNGLLPGILSRLQTA